MPQKQPPARIAVSVFAIAPSCRHPEYPFRAGPEALGSAQVSLAICEHGRELLDEPIELGALDGERRRQADHLRVRVFREHTALEKPLAERARRAGCSGDLDADEQAAAADFLYARHAQRAQLLVEILAPCCRSLGEPLVDEHAQRRAADGGGERIAAERAAVI